MKQAVMTQTSMIITLASGVKAIKTTYFTDGEKRGEKVQPIKIKK